MTQEDHSPMHVLGKIYSTADLASIKAGRVPTSGRKADPQIAFLLADEQDPDYFATSLARWFEVALSHPEVENEYRARLRAYVSNGPQFWQTAAELMAAYFLERQMRFELRFVPREHGKKTPDFEVTRDGCRAVVEVKTLVWDADPGSNRYSGTVPDRAPVIRKAIKSASSQLAREDINLVILADWHRPPMPRHTFEDAMFGSLRVCPQVDESGPAGDWRFVQMPNGKCNPYFHKRITVVGALRWTGYPDSYCCFLHNPYAYNPAPRSLFEGLPHLWYNAEHTGLVV